MNGSNSELIQSRTSDLFCLSIYQLLFCNTVVQHLAGAVPSSTRIVFPMQTIAIAFSQRYSSSSSVSQRSLLQY